MTTIEQLTTSPVAPFEPESWDDFVEGWHHLNRLADGVTWYRGQLVSQLKGRYGEKAVEKFAEEVGYSTGRLYEFAQVFERFNEMSARAENLSFQHFKSVLALEDSEAEEWLARADTERWSARELQRQVSEADAKVIDLKEKREPRPDPDTCPRCETEKPLADFLRRNGSYATWCQTCRAIDQPGNPDLTEGTPANLSEMLGKWEVFAERLHDQRDKYGADLSPYAQGQMFVADEVVKDLRAVTSGVSQEGSWTS